MATAVDEVKFTIFLQNQPVYVGGGYVVKVQQYNQIYEEQGENKAEGRPRGLYFNW